ncbi:MAG: tRNA (N6-threonylcarbamoyladenosine(37)-N6)-methyltransferase TrmO [Clostridia bacterium]|nr:tRNA (N6-threonylcarbamoyladenosine(37)-N6)-methyltransferase TrmO [Clostridia bacterium]
MEIKPIAYIKNDYSSKFGIPRQSGIVGGVVSKIVFCGEYRDASALRGIEEYSHLWLIWGFSENEGKGWSPTVRPPRLGGNRRVGVFATRSPFRPNPIGLSCVKLERTEKDGDNGVVLCVSGADMLSGTPIYDIKPYVSYTDSVTDALCSFADEHKYDSLNVIIPEKLSEKLPEDRRETVEKILAGDPRPAYQDDPDRIYGFGFAGYEIRFKVSGDTLTVISIEDAKA